MISSNRTKISSHWSYRDKEETEPVLVNLPHTNRMLPYNYFDEKDYQFISYYEKDLTFEDITKRYVLRFDGAMSILSLYADGACMGELRGGYLPMELEIPREIVERGQVHLMAVLNSEECEQIPPFGNVLDYMTFGGIYRDVWLYELNETFIEQAFLKYQILEHDGETGNVELCPEILIDSARPGREVTLTITLGEKKITRCFRTEAGKQTIRFPAFIVEHRKLWSTEHPNRHLCHMELAAEKVLDEAQLQLGFRELLIGSNQLILNGKRMKIRGLNRHQTFPYVGGAMPGRVQEQDAVILKEELGLNTVRTSHYPQSEYFLDKCDEIGLLVLEEIPGWQYISQREDWRAAVLENVEGMIVRDRNHPSIFSWGVRINESGDDHELYSKTNELARALDDSRLTCGIRCLEHSEFLEDIYTMNDFVHDGTDNVLLPRQRCTGLDAEVPYLVTEFGGHIFPTKRFDQEQRLIEHALRHGRVQSRAAQYDEYMGAIGWCAFDYNTHSDFGSGDRICYHGVMDMFRIPKLAAAIYQSQMDPRRKPVLVPLTLWTRGERDKAETFPIYVCSNCDTIEVKMNGITKAKLVRNLTTTDLKMQYLDYPPFFVDIKDGEWGERWQGAEFIGYEKGEALISKKFVSNPVYQDLVVKPDSTRLSAEEHDAFRVEVRAVDQAGNLLPFCNEAIRIETEGNVLIEGPARVALIGGCIAFWVRSGMEGETGAARVTVTADRGFSKSFEVELI